VENKKTHRDGTPALCVWCEKFEKKVSSGTRWLPHGKLELEPVRFVQVPYDAGRVVRSASFTPRAKSVPTQQKNICAERLGMDTDVRKRCMKSVEGEAPPARRFERPSRVIALQKLNHAVAASIAVCDTYIPPSMPVMA